jgi:hypothetical protein
MADYFGPALGLAAAVLISSTAMAVERSDLEKSTVKAATDCVAAAALNNPNITTLYRQNRLKEVTDWIVLKSSACDNPLRAMRLLHDRIYGAGTGRRFLRGDYLADLPRAVRERVSDEVERRIALEAYATAPLPSREGGELNNGAELRVVNVGPNDVLNIRQYATASSPIIDIIPPNARGVIYLGERQGQWIFIRYEDRAEGWVQRQFVQPIASQGRRLQ